MLFAYMPISENPAGTQIYEEIDCIYMYLPSMSAASQRQTKPNAPWPKMLKNFNRCRGNSHRSDFICECSVELLVDSCDVACKYIITCEHKINKHINIW